MTVALPPALAAARQGPPLARVAVVAVLAVPLVIVTVALIPAFVICPFLGAGRQRLVTRLLAHLLQWTAVLVGPAVTRQRSTRPGCSAHQTRAGARV